MKKWMMTVLLAAVTLTVAAQSGKGVVAQTPGCVTFVVDEGLPEPEECWRGEGKWIKTGLLESRSSKPQVVAASFADDDRFAYFEEDAFYRTFVEAYAKHRPLVLSPDMIWMIIAQGFAGYVGAHPEELRQSLVDHDGKMDLVVTSPRHLLSDSVDWAALLDSFSASIANHTKGDIANTLTADFTTTGAVERLASQVTLMKAVENYFGFIAIRIVCGIPSITLQGTPDDWRQVLDKTRSLEQYGLKEWTDELIPVLQQFVDAAEGRPDQAFWQNIVRRVRADELRGGGCSSAKPTELDGWFLVFFPDKQGHTRKRVKHNETMPSEVVHVGFKYLQADPVTGSVSTTPMELSAGFVGADVDTLTQALKPKIGWIVSLAATEEEQLERMKRSNFGIYLRVDKVPEVLAGMQTIDRLTLVFTDRVELPDWLDRLTINHLSVSGRMTLEEKQALERRFPQAQFYCK